MSTCTPVLLLIVLLSHTKSDPGDAVCLNAEQWVSILVLADKYEMTLLRDAAVKKLKIAHPRLNPVKQIAIARKYCCDELVEEPFERLVARKEVLSREEIAQLPLEDLHGLIIRREALQRAHANPTLGQYVHCTQTETIPTAASAPTPRSQPTFATRSLRTPSQPAYGFALTSPSQPIFGFAPTR